MDAANKVVAHEAVMRLRNVLARMRLKAMRSAVRELRDDVGEVFAEEEELAERQLEELLRLAGGGTAVSA